MPIQNLWDDIQQVGAHAKERVGFPTQKPLALLERIIKASSNEGDVVFDPFCGCATACIAAEVLKRQWVGIDIAEMAYTLVRQRLLKEVGIGSKERIHFTGREVIHRTDIPKRTDFGELSLTIEPIGTPSMASRKGYALAAVSCSRSAT